MELANETPIMMAAFRTQNLAELGLEAAFRENYPRLVAIVSRIVGDRARAEELASDAFLRLARQPLAAADYENLGGWLYRTATRLAIDWLRAEARRKRYEQAAGEELAGSAESPLEDVLRTEQCRRVRAALARLKPAQSQLLTLRSSGLTYRELAAALGMRLASVGRLLARAEAAFERAYGRVK